MNDIWVHNLNPFLIQFSSTFGIRWYGLAYLTGFIIGAMLMIFIAKRGRRTISPEMVTDYITYIVLGVMIGGRLGYALFYSPDLLSDFSAKFPFWGVLRVWEGGMSSHGGMFGVGVALWWYTRKRAIGFLATNDLIVTTAPLGLLFGRLANFINGELWGNPTRVPWAVIFPASPPPLMPRHPSQLYEAVLEGVVLFALMQWRFWKSPAAKQPGRITGEFLVAYTVARAVCETYREPDAALILGLSRGTFYSLFLLAVGLALIAFAGRQNSERKA